jgi:hypothetical protein
LLLSFSGDRQEYEKLPIDVHRLPGLKSKTWATRRRLHGHKQVTDAYLLGMAIEDDLIIATFDKRIGHLVGEYAEQVLILGE